MANSEHLRILKGGVEKWNAWREKNPGIIPDLSDADIRDMRLVGANFESTDIRGTNFIGSDLADANLVSAKAGISKRVIVFLLFAACFSGFITGVYSYIGGFLVNGASGLFIEQFFGRSNLQLKIIITNLILFILSIILIISILRNRFEQTFLAVLIVAALIGIVARITSDPGQGTNLLISMGMTGVMIFIVGLFAVLPGAFAVAVVVAAAIAGAGIGIVTIVATFLMSVGCSIVLARIFTENLAGTVALAMTSVSLDILACFIAWQAIKTYGEQFSLLWKISLSLGTYRGTRFSSDKLARVNFQNVDLRGTFFYTTQFSGPSFVHTCWKNVKNLDFTYLFGTYLENRKIRTLLVSLDQNQQTDLGGLNLQRSHLVEANLRHADLRNSDLDGANLSNADITDAKLYATSREDWQIEGIRCEYVCWDKDGMERTPPDRDFEPGEFEKLYKQLPTFDYFFEGNFTPIDVVIMDQVVQAINEKHPEFELQLDSFSSRSNPHAKFTVFHKEDTDNAYQEIKAQYEARIAALEHDKEKLFALTQTLVDNPRQINQYYMQIEGDVIDIDAQKNVAYAKNQSKTEITDGE